MKLILSIISVSIFHLVVSTKHLTVVGKNSWLTHSSGNKPDECTDDTSTTGVASNSYGNQIGAQCCNVAGTTGYREGLGPNNECLTGLNYEDAKKACEDEGYRLCTAAEVRDNVGAGSGCSHDARHVWTADPCGAHWIQIGKSEKETHSSGTKEEECTDDASTTGVASNSYGNEIGVQCCKDTTKTIDLGFLGKHKYTVTEGYRQNLPGGVDYDGYTDCLKNVNYNTAKSACESKGDRLCTYSEVEANIGAGTGCSHDMRHVWTSLGCGADGLDDFLVKRYAPYLRFDTFAVDGLNGFPSAYNHPNGKASRQNMNPSISGIPTYYHVYHDASGKPKSIGYFWYYEFQTACLYDGVTGLNKLPGDLENAITNAITGLPFIAAGDIGEHDNDNEKIFVNLNNDYSLKSVTFHQHNGKYTITASSGKLSMYQSSHPHVFIGRTSHGSYHNAMSNIGGCGYFHDYRDGQIKRKSWDNLQPAHYKSPSDEREEGWSSNSFCGSTGCDWSYCETSSEINSNPDKCTPLNCNKWKTPCLPWGVSDIVQASANVKDKYFWLYDTGHPDCGCETIIVRICVGEHIEGQVCTPAFADMYPMLPNPETVPIDDKNHDNNDYNKFTDNKNVTFTMSVRYLLIFGLMVIILCINCVKTTIYEKCVKYSNKYKGNNIKYKSVKIDSESEVEEEFMA